MFPPKVTAYVAYPPRSGRSGPGCRQAWAALSGGPEPTRLMQSVKHRDYRINELVDRYLVGKDSRLSCRNRHAWCRDSEYQGTRTGGVRATVSCVGVR